MAWHYSGGVDNTAGSASFGDRRAMNQGDANLTWNLESTLTTGTGADKRIVIDTTQIGAGADVHVGKAMLLVDGNAALDASRIVSFDDSTGTFIVEAPFTAVVDAGDTYQLFELNDMMDSVGASDCAFGSTDYRLVYLRNLSGQSANKIYFYTKVIGGTGQLGAAVEVELWGRKNQGTNESTVADDEAGPPESQLLSNDRFAKTEVRFSVESTPALPFNSLGDDPALGNNNHRAVWIKRIVPPNARRNDFVVVQITAEFESNDDQTIVTSSMLLVFSLAGFTPLIDLRPDRGPIRTEQQISDGYTASMRLGHGARMIAEVRALETDLVVPDLEIGWTLEGPGQLFTPDGPVTDANGIARSTYSAPSDSTAGRQAIAFESFGFSSTQLDDLAIVSHDHTILAGTEGAIYAFVMAASPDDPPSPADLAPIRRLALSVTLDGVFFDRLASIDTVSGGRIEVWQLLAPAVGTGSMVATLPAAVSSIGFVSLSFSGVDQINPLDVDPTTQRIDDDPATTFAQSITTVTPGAELVTVALTMHPFDATITTDAPAVFRGAGAVGTTPLVSLAQAATQPAPAVGLQTLTFSTLVTGQDRLGILLALRPSLTSAIVSAQV